MVSATIGVPPYFYARFSTGAVRLIVIKPKQTVRHYRA
jgi:hypothetical protein